MIVKDIPQKQQKQSFLLHVTVKTPASRGCSCGSVSQVLQDDGAMMQDLVFPESMRLQATMEKYASCPSQEGRVLDVVHTHFASFFYDLHLVTGSYRVVPRYITLILKTDVPKKQRFYYCDGELILGTTAVSEKLF